MVCCLSCEGVNILICAYFMRFVHRLSSSLHVGFSVVCRHLRVGSGVEHQHREGLLYQQRQLQQRKGAGARRLSCPQQ